MENCKREELQEEEKEPENALEILERKGQGEIEVCSYFISGMAQAKELLNDLNKLWYNFGLHFIHNTLLRYKQAG